MALPPPPSPSAATGVVEPRSVPAFLPRRISVGPRFSGKVREEPQRRERGGEKSVSWLKERKPNEPDRLNAQELI
jgi:hypothetical protein